MSTLAFSDLRTAAYCPRKLYYLREDDDRTVPESVLERRELAFRYPEILDGGPDRLADTGIALTPTQLRSNLSCVRARLDSRVWTELADPSAREVFLAGRDCHGVVHKLLELDPPIPSLVSAGTPPETGVWEPRTVHAIAAAKALSWEREREIERAFVEYPAHGIVREVPLSPRRVAAYRRALRTTRAIDGPPPRIDNRSKCEQCEYRETCGVRTRSLRSLLGFG